VLIAGDAGWTVEAECTGSLMCGLKAAHAISEALRDGKPNASGVQQYSTWWHKHFTEAMDHTEFLQLLTSALAGEDASNCPNKLVTETLPCSLNPYNLLKSVTRSIMGKVDRIQKERPDIIDILQQLDRQTLRGEMKRFTLTGFPNA
jgi:hypothetical protein